MRKLNVVFIQGDKKDDALLKIKDDSLTITTNDGNLIKIPYSNIKDYSYQEEDEQLSINQYGGSTICLGMKKDQQLINQLREASLQKNEEKIKINNEVINTKQNEEQYIPNNNVNSGSDSLIGKVIFVAFIVLIGIFFVPKIASLLGIIENNTETEAASIPEDMQGFYRGYYFEITNLYKIYKLDADKLTITYCSRGILANCDFNGDYAWEYEIRNISGDDDIFFDAYSDGEKGYECIASFGTLLCSSSGGSTDRANKIEY